ncbi:hypothetical protein C9I89_18760 [Photobacterium lipolyticum]|uniref:Uncharacterized protein n=1 Tax=Photobacterium lipolyticum TaxID=266810 RepID=A0A2T3MTD3_9GAMM|nr:hypothetical protein C9I89_18760 [Photobacterium lipolyticum]
MSTERTRSYTEQYFRISAKTFRPMLNANPGIYRVGNSNLGQEHQIFRLIVSSNWGRAMIFNIQSRKHLIPLKLDNRSASNKLYLVCPYCSRQRQHLYAVSEAYACRTCLKLSYACQSECKLERLARKIRDIRKSIWGASCPGLNNLCDNSFLWPKPKWMRYNTFDTATAKLRLLERQYLKLSLEQFDRMFGEVGKQEPVNKNMDVN